MKTAAAGMTKSNSYAQMYLNKQVFSTPQKSSANKQSTDSIVATATGTATGDSANKIKRNPITAEGHAENIFRPSVKKTQFSDIDNIKSPLPPKIQRTSSNADCGYLRNQSESKDWKPSVKRVEQKDSEHFEVFEKRSLKTTPSNVGTTSSSNPLLGGDNNSKSARQGTGNGDQVISTQYQKIADRRELLSAGGNGSRNTWEKYTQSSIFTSNTSQQQPSSSQQHTRTTSSKFSGSNAKSLLNYDYALPYQHGKDLTDKINRTKNDNKYIGFTEANDFDFRKRSNKLQKEEVQAQSQQSSRRAHTELAS